VGWVFEIGGIQTSNLVDARTSLRLVPEHSGAMEGGSRVTLFAPPIRAVIGPKKDQTLASPYQTGFFRRRPPPTWREMQLAANEADEPNCRDVQMSR
jgi:hypothetical protein